MKFNAKAYLRSVGFQFDKTPVKLDRMFYTSLNEDGKHLFAEYSATAPEYKNIKDLLKIPTTAKQAARLFSSDANRCVASMECIENFLSHRPPGNALDIGCGAGFLVEYLSKKYPAFHFEGLESQKNLAEIAGDLTGKKIFHLNYLSEIPPQRYDYVLCEFGWDSSDIAKGGAPHELEELDGHQYCSGCSEAAQSSYTVMFQNWELLLAENGTLLVTGRLGTIGDLLAFLNAANSCGLASSERDSRWIYWKHDGIRQQAPALVFTRDARQTDEEIERTARGLYRRISN